MDRTLNISRLKTESFDICIIGGGASGAGCALDAALRGYKVAIIDKKDFSSETSSRSTKLIHGGVRYLEQAFTKLDFAQLKQVRHGLQERQIVLQNAPHLARPLALLTPVFSWFEGLYYSLGLRIYDWFAQNNSLPKGKWLNRREVLQRMPGLDADKIHSAVLYYDGQLDDARYCMALVQTAHEQGAVAANYVAVDGFIRNNESTISAVNVQDTLARESFQIKADIFINCTGVFSDSIRLLANPSLPRRLRTSKGVHVILPLEILGSRDAMLIPKTSDGRVVFAIPFEGRLLVGTTDTEYTQVEKEPVLEKNEVAFLMGALRPYITHKLTANQVKSGFGGLRPLLAADPTKATKGLTRDHEVEHDAVSNLVSLLGGKWTTYRLMAKDTLDKVDELRGERRPCRTADFTLTGGRGYSDNAWKSLHEESRLEEVICRHLSTKYGSRAGEVVQLIQSNSSLSDRLSPSYPFIKAEVVYQVRQEMAVMPRDVLARRLRLEIADWQATLDCLDTVCDLMATELGWSPEIKHSMKQDYAHTLEFYQQEAGL